MNIRRVLEIGGLVAGVVLIAFGAVAIYMGFDGRNTVRDSIKQEQIFFGNAAEDEAVAKHAEQWSEEQVLDGDQARAFALIIREHALGARRPDVRGDGPLRVRRRSQRSEGDERRGGCREGRGRPADLERRPEHLGDRDRALERAEHELHGGALAIFGIVVGVALLLSGVGFMVLALVVLGGALPRNVEAPSAA